MIVTLCASYKHREYIPRIAYELAAVGHMVLRPLWYEHDLHDPLVHREIGRNQVEASHSIVAMNVGHTMTPRLSEIVRYATERKKAVYWYEGKACSYKTLLLKPFSTSVVTDEAFAYTKDSLFNSCTIIEVASGKSIGPAHNANNAETMVEL